MSIRRDTAYNLLGQVTPLIISLVTIPMYIGLIGEARYGVLVMAWLLLGYFGLFDFGLGRATAQSLAALRDSTPAARAQVFWTSLVLNCGIGAVGGLLAWPITSYLFTDVFVIEGALRLEIQSVVPWLAVAVPVAIICSMLDGALLGRECFLELNLIAATGAILFQILPLGAAILGSGHLEVLLPAAVCARLITLCMLFLVCRRQLWCGHRLSFERAAARRLLRFGGWVAVTSFVGPMMVILDRFIIGAISGAKAVSYYNVPFQLCERSTIISSSLASALFPRFPSATPLEKQRLAQDALRLLIFVMTPLVLVGILFIEPFLAWWLTSEFAQNSSLVGQIVLVGFWFNALALIPYSQLQARGKPDLVAKCHLAELLPYLGLLYLGLKYFGLVGAAIAFSVRVIADFGLLAGLAGIFPWVLRVLAKPLLLLAAAFFIGRWFTLGTNEWMVLVLIHLTISAVWFVQKILTEWREWSL